MCLWHILLEEKVPKAWERVQRGPLTRGTNSSPLRRSAPPPHSQTPSPSDCPNPGDPFRTQTPSYGSSKHTPAAKLLRTPCLHNPTHGSRSLQDRFRKHPGLAPRTLLIPALTFSRIESLLFPGPPPDPSRLRPRALGSPIKAFSRAPPSSWTRLRPRALPAPPLSSPRSRTRVPNGSALGSSGLRSAPSLWALGGRVPNFRRSLPLRPRLLPDTRTFPHQCHPRDAPPAASVAGDARKRRDWLEP